MLQQPTHFFCCKRKFKSLITMSNAFLVCVHLLIFYSVPETFSIFICISDFKICAWLSAEFIWQSESISEIFLARACGQGWKIYIFRLSVRVDIVYVSLTWRYGMWYNGPLSIIKEKRKKSASYGFVFSVRRSAMEIMSPRTRQALSAPKIAP